MEQDVEERNQQRDCEAIEQRREQVGHDRDAHAPGVRAQEGNELLVDGLVHWEEAGGGRREGGRGELQSRKRGSQFANLGTLFPPPSSRLPPPAFRLPHYRRGVNNASGKITSSGVTPP